MTIINSKVIFNKIKINICELNQKIKKFYKLMNKKNVKILIFKI